MRKAKVFFNNELAGHLSEIERGKKYRFDYLDNYAGPPISHTMPVSLKVYEYECFPLFFDGLLPEGPQLEALLKQTKLDRDDYLGQIISVGSDLVGAVTMEEAL